MRQIRKNRDVDVHAVRAVLFQTDAADLQRTGFHPSLRHVVQNLLQRYDVRRRQ